MTDYVVLQTPSLFNVFVGKGMSRGVIGYIWFTLNQYSYYIISCK